MGLKIITPIGTDKGITEEAYVRITSYSISKNGNVNLSVELFLNKAASQNTVQPFGNYGNASNQMISNNHSFMVTKDVITTVTKTRPVTTYDATTGEPTYTEESYQEEVTSTVSDIASLETVNIFEFCYNSLRVKLEDLFGIANIIND